MRLYKVSVFLSLATLATLAGGAVPAVAESTTVEVTLWDRGDPNMATDMGMGMAKSVEDLANATMGVKADKLEVKAGEVTFHVTNLSKETIHEMLVVPVTDGGKALPYVQDEQRVDEEAANDVGEVAELETGKDGALSVNLAPGQYALLCNVPGHYMNGMWTVVTVVP